MSTLTTDPLLVALTKDNHESTANDTTTSTGRAETGRAGAAKRLARYCRQYWYVVVSLGFGAVLSAGLRQVVHREPARSYTHPTQAATRLSRADSVYNFGSVAEGALVSHTFRFVNTGTLPLCIAGVVLSCGCTVADWSRKPVFPHQEGTISVRFDSKARRGRSVKHIAVIVNTDPVSHSLRLEGEVR